MVTREIALLSESEVRVTLPQEPPDENDDTSVETFILLLNDELGLAPANVFLGQSVVNIEDTGKRRLGMILYNVVSCRQASLFHSFSSSIVMHGSVSIVIFATG